jgi:phosphatidylglycerophosphate synthase
MRKWYREYMSLLKDTAVEELFDLYLFRPFAFLVVKLVSRTSITPNQLSISSMVTGILSSVFFSLGTVTSFLVGGILYGMTRVLDCSDGMVARLKKNGTIVGRIMDGTVDYVNGIVIYVGFFVGINRAGFEFSPSNFWLVLGAGLCMIFHSIVIDYYRNKFLAHGLGKMRTPREDKQMFTDELKKLKKNKGRLVDKFFIHLYLGYTHVQVNRAVKGREYKKDVYYRTNKMIMQMWSLVGSSTYIFIFMISGILYRPAILFWYAIVASNIFICILWIIQVRKNRKIHHPFKV